MPDETDQTEWPTCPVCSAPVMARHQVSIDMRTGQGHPCAIAWAEYAVARDPAYVNRNEEDLERATDQAVLLLDNLAARLDLLTDAAHLAGVNTVEDIIAS